MRLTLAYSFTATTVKHTERRGIMTDIHQRICAVSKEIEKTDNRIDYLTQKRKKLEIRKKALENEELLEIIRTNGANVTTLSDDLLLGKLIRENNITANDIIEMVFVTQQKNTED